MGFLNTPRGADKTNPKEEKKTQIQPAGIRSQGDRNEVSDAREWGERRFRSMWKQSGKSQVMAA